MSIRQHVQPHRHPAPLSLVASIIVAALGGFVGGALLENGPTYLNVHVTQPWLAETTYEAEPQALASKAEPIPTESAEEAVPVERVANVPEMLSGADARIVVHAGQTPYLILRAKADSTWGRGVITSKTGDGVLTTLRQPANTEVLPSELQAWIGSPVTLYNAKGYTCQGEIERIELLEQFAGDGVEPEGWDSYSSGPQLAARVRPVKGQCSSATWARDSRLPSPGLARVQRGTKKERRMAREAFRKTDKYQELQERYLAEGNSGPWDKFWDNELQIQVLRSARQDLIFVQAQVGGCGDFDGQLGSVFVQSETRELTLLPTGESFLSDVLAAADIDNDGDLDLITQGDGFDRSLVVQDDAAMVETSHSEVPIYFCRC